MPNSKLSALSSTGALSCLLATLLLGCTGIMSGDPNGGAVPPTGLGSAGSAGSSSGTGGSTAAASSKPEVDVMTIRRLNRTEYTNTLRALTATSEDHGAKFPADNLSFGFDNIGEALTVQPLHIEMFEQTAETVLSELFARPAGDAVRGKVLACDAQSAGHPCVVSTVMAFAERAFRRPVTEAEVTPFINIADTFTQSGGTAADGLKLALKGVLLSPHFLFRVELDPSPTSKEQHPLNAFELATRLSYYLWSTMPDDALYADAKSGVLTTDAGLLVQVGRMMMDAKAAKQLGGDAHLQVAPLANQLAELIALLPALQAVLENLLGFVLLRARIRQVRPRLERGGQAVEHGRDVIVESGRGRLLRK